MNLIVSVLTVVAVLLFFIGFKNGFLIGSGLIFSIFGTLIYMQATGIALQRMSLAAIIIAMGMLVDNAIVVYDAALVNMHSYPKCCIKHCHATPRSYSDCSPHLSAGVSFTPYYRRNPFFIIHRDSRFSAAQLDSGHHTKRIFRSRICKTPTTGRIEKRIVQRPYI